MCHLWLGVDINAISTQINYSRGKSCSQRTQGTEERANAFPLITEVREGLCETLALCGDQERTGKRKEDTRLGAAGKPKNTPENGRL